MLAIAAVLVEERPYGRNIWQGEGTFTAAELDLIGAVRLAARMVHDPTMVVGGIERPMVREILALGVDNAVVAMRESERVDRNGLLYEALGEELTAVQAGFRAVSVDLPSIAVNLQPALADVRAAMGLNSDHGIGGGQS